LFGQKGKEEEEEEEEEEEVLDEDGRLVFDSKKGYYGSLLCVIPAAEQFLQ
jgi:streptogramin lyase